MSNPVTHSFLCPRKFFALVCTPCSSRKRRVYTRTTCCKVPRTTSGLDCCDDVTRSCDVDACAAVATTWLSIARRNRPVLTTWIHTTRSRQITIIDLLLLLLLLFIYLLLLFFTLGSIDPEGWNKKLSYYYYFYFIYFLFILYYPYYFIIIILLLLLLLLSQAAR